MPKWIHDRAEHLLAKNPSMPKSQAFAIATQQSHALGKSPKGYGTSEGRAEAKAKYGTPKDDKKAANPGGLDSPKLASFFDELAKIGAVTDAQAERALARYEALSQAKPTAGQVGRYAAIGAVATPAIGAVGDLISGNPTRLRGHLARAATGALTASALPIARHALDRRAEMGTLKTYLREKGIDPAHRGPPTAGKLSAPFEPVEKTARRHVQRALGAVRAARGFAKGVDPRVVQQMQQEGLERAGERLGGKEKDSGASGYTPARPFNANAYTVDLVKGAFATSAYSANLPYPRVPQKSFQPGFRMPNLGSVSQADPQQIKTGGENVRDVFARVFDHYLRGGTRFTKAAAGAPTRGGFLMSSEMPGFRAPSLRSPAAQAPQQIVTKLGSVPTTPAGLLASSKRVGAPRVSAPPGPSIAQVAKPVGFGRPKPGSAKDIL